MKSGIEVIADERKRQVEVEGWTAEHDDLHLYGEMVDAAVAYLSPNRPGDSYQVRDERSDCVIYRDPWPWDVDWDKRKKHNRLKRLAIAGALIAAEIDRLQR